MSANDDTFKTPFYALSAPHRHSYLADNSPRSHDAPLSNCPVRKNGHVPANEAILLDCDAATDQQPLAPVAHRRIHWRSQPVKLDVWPDDCAIANRDLACILHITPRLNDHIVAEMDVVAIFACKG